MVEPVRSDVRRGDPETARSKPFVFSLALAPGRGLREDQWRNSLSVAGCRSRRRSAGILCHQTSPPQGCTGFSEESDEAVWSAKGHRHRSSSIISGCDGSLGNARRQEIGRWLNNRGENSHLPFRRREYSMQRFCREKTLQKLVSVHSEVCNHFNHERHLGSRDDFKGRREATLVEWQQLSTA